jgi:phosphoribosylformylglycinamidine synthase PurS subunit
VNFLAKVFILPKPAVLDPQGKAVVSGLASLGFEEIQDVRVGRYIELRLSADTATAAGERVDSMCSRLLANEVMETYRLEIEEADGPS